MRHTVVLCGGIVGLSMLFAPRPAAAEPKCKGFLGKAQLVGRFESSECDDIEGGCYLTIKVGNKRHNLVVDEPKQFRRGQKLSVSIERRQELYEPSATCETFEVLMGVKAIR